MYKKTMTYTDYDGNTRTDDFYFNLTKAELVEMEMSVSGGMQQMLERVMKDHDGKRIMETIKDLILRSYGEKSTDGKRFVKTAEMRDTFVQTEAYSDLFMELVTDAEKAAEFVNGIVPKEVAEQAKALSAPTV